MVETNTNILFVMVALMLAFIFIGEKTHIGIYFLLAIFPAIFMMLQIGIFMFYVFGGLIVAFCGFRALHAKGD